MEDLVVFELCGPMAHFRKYYTNSSSLSYSFPPRSTMMGIIAAVLGWKRDSYYEEMGLKRASFAVSVKTPVRKIIQTVNYTRTKDSDLGKIHKGVPGTQIPMEILVPGLGHHRLVFRIYFNHVDSNILDELEDRLQKGRSYFPLYLGISEFLATSEFVARIKKEEIIIIPPGACQPVATVCNAELLESIDNQKSEESLQYVREKAPLSFGAEREIMPSASFIYEKNQRPLWGKFRKPVYKISCQGKEEVVVFMEAREEK